MTNIGNKIKERREDLGLSQDDLAEMMGYKSRSTIAKIEKGVNDVTQTNIVKFAKVLKTTPAYLMGWEQEQQKNDIITDVTIRLLDDSDFMDVVEILYNIDDTEQMQSIKRMLTAFLK